ncbi:hypothetical protein ID551_27480, partial [Klebsiella pneumoniae]|nr:hypothetical protein [Klebsiella pneumoniae]
MGFQPLPAPYRRFSRKLYAAIPVVSSLLLAPLSAFADEAWAQQQSSAWGLGLGVVSTQKPYTDIDRKYTPLPLLYYENRYARLF